MCLWWRVLIFNLNLLDTRKCPVDSDSNTEANARLCEQCNTYLCVQELINFLTSLQFIKP